MASTFSQKVNDPDNEVGRFLLGGKVGLGHPV